MKKEEEKRMYSIGRKWMFAFMDVMCMLGAYFLALLFRYDCEFSNIPPFYIREYVRIMPYWVLVAVIVFYIFHLYHSIWSMAGTAEMNMIFAAYAGLVPVYWCLSFLSGMRMPEAWYIMGHLLSLCFVAAWRFSYRGLIYLIRWIERTNAKERVMVIGAGEAGRLLTKELRSSDKLDMKICCFIDDDQRKIGQMLEGIPIVGNRYSIREMAEKYKITRILYAIPTGDDNTRREILNLCKETRCKLRTVPGLYQLANDEVRLSNVRDVEVTDLLGRKQIKVNNEEIFSEIKGKTVLVTGGGGSIGSELCRQIAGAGVGRLIIFEMYENNAYEIQQELKRRYPQLDLMTLIGSIRNTKRLDKIMRELTPDIVFHAAAHKHVPLMEESPNEAIKNNAIGTWNTATAAARYGVKKFVLISSDKAVNPTNIMGASKRLCEMVIQMMDRQCTGTDFVAVRFGNVLGSNGSVIPLFKKQIEEGGPVTVTDKNIIRYFMTIPEAVALVLQASHYARGGEIFVLDMGEPVRIDDMARNLIRLSGYVPDVDIKIEYTGLRPGEKLYEELLMDEEGLTATANELIHIGKPIQMDDEWFREKLAELDEASYQEEAHIRELVSELVPTYHYKKENSEALAVAKERERTPDAGKTHYRRTPQADSWRIPAAARWGEVAMFCSTNVTAGQTIFGNGDRRIL